MRPAAFLLWKAVKAWAQPKAAPMLILLVHCPDPAVKIIGAKGGELRGVVCADGREAPETVLCPRERVDAALFCGDPDGINTFRTLRCAPRAGDAAIVLPARGNGRIGEEAPDEMRLVKVEIVRRQHAAALRLAQKVGQRLHTEAVVVGDKQL